MELIVGDVHGKFSALEKIVNNTQADVVTLVGDVGLGFPGTMDCPFTPSVPIRFIPGNHDNPSFCRDLTWHNWRYIEHGEVINNTLFIGGARSIDKAMRMNGVSWWPEEEVSAGDEYRILNHLEFYKGSIDRVITHDCPLSAYPMYGIKRGGGSTTSTFLEHLLREVLVGDLKPKTWIHGHHHISRKFSLLGVDFIGLKELETCIGYSP